MCATKNRNRKRVLFTLDEENHAYVQEKGKRFRRGKRGGDSEALNRMIKFVRDYEDGMAGNEKD